MSAARTVTANFTLNTYTLTVNKTGPGQWDGDERSDRHQLWINLLGQPSTPTSP